MVGPTHSATELLALKSYLWDRAHPHAARQAGPQLSSAVAQGALYQSQVAADRSLRLACEVHPAEGLQVDRLPGHNHLSQVVIHRDIRNRYNRTDAVQVEMPVHCGLERLPRNVAQAPGSAGVGPSLWKHNLRSRRRRERATDGGAPLCHSVELPVPIIAAASTAAAGDESRASACGMPHH